ncbi:MAG TPA: hypothetical protein VK203_21160 [Nostocaceae cyanobacterium]|nr:hypothetical protein [Nostocaceae cyanobacterium]
MFPLLSRVLLWLLIAVVAYALFQRLYPAGSFVGRVALGLVALIIVLAFVNPTEPAVSSIWRFVSFPLKPLGASVLMLGVAATKIQKDGGIKAPGGYLLGWALVVLFLSSTPVVAYFLVRSPVGATANINLDTAPSTTLVAMLPTTTTSNILPVEESSQDVIALNPLDVKIAPYLLQRPQDIRSRGLRLEDFVPNAETLQLTTQIWESYLNQIYFFLRGR